MTEIMDNRGVSEAITQSLLFLYLTGLIITISSGAAPVIDQLEGEETFRQNIEGLERINELIYEYDTHSSTNDFATANKTARFNSLQSTIETGNETKIRITDNSQTYEINSTPIQFTHQDYTLTYDSGLTQYSTHSNTTVYETPSEHSQLAGDQFLLLSMTVDPDITTNSTRDHTAIVSAMPPEQGILNEGGSNTTEITITTDQKASWMQYLEETSKINSISSSDITENRVEITATVSDEISIHYQQFHIK